MNVRGDSERRLSRREFMQTGGAAMGALALPAFESSNTTQRTRHVLLIAFAGGVRSRDTFGTPANVPNLLRLAEKGVVFPNCGTSHLDHASATLDIFTGACESLRMRERMPQKIPTVFELLRGNEGLSARQIWLSTSDAARGVNFAYSGAGADAADLERLVFDELQKLGSAGPQGPGSDDASALHVAGKVLKSFRPSILGVALSNADVAHGSFDAYVEVIRRNDEQLGGILDVVERDVELRRSTAIFVLPEFGRDRYLNHRNGLDHGDGSSDLQRVTCVAAGPDFRSGRIVEAGVRTVDVCPTICKLQGARASVSGGRVLPGLFS